MSATTKAADDEGESQILASEYEHQPVPESARLSLFGNIAVWFGFPMIITGAMTGSILVLGMGFRNALVAMIIGNIFMFLYVGLLGRVGANTGRNFALIATDIFGTKGYMFASGLLSTLLLGWYAVQTGITAALVHTAYDLNYILMAIIAGVLYLGITFVGVKGLHYIGVISVPLFAVLGLWTIFASAGTSGWSNVWAYAGNKGAATMSMGVGLTVVIALFADAGTVAADFNRWARNSKDSWISTFTAFPLANFFAMLVGGVMTAAIATPDQNPFGSDNMFGYMNAQHLTWLAGLAFIFLFINLGSVCSHVLYNSATGWSRILNTKMRLMAVVLGAIGIFFAAINVWAYFVQWLTILGVLVPPIGGVVLIDRYILKRGDVSKVEWRFRALASWAIGSVAGLLVEFNAPGLSTALAAFVCGAVAYYVIMKSSAQAEESAGVVGIK